MADAARTAAANGAANIKFVIDNGVTVQTAHSTSPAARASLPDDTLPLGNATSGNVAVHTGTHLFESDTKGMDDIFIAARAAGIKSVFAGGDANYMAFTSADFNYAARSPTTSSSSAPSITSRTTACASSASISSASATTGSGPADKTNPASA